MKVINVDNLKGTERDVQFTGGNSLRPILESDNMGFTFCRTHIPKGEPNYWHYTNHLESCYCVSGTGELIDLETNEVYKIAPGVIYILDKNQRHTFQAFTDVVLISIFNPPLKGTESHDENGNYK
jgi:L-ectoine synthase